MMKKLGVLSAILVVLVGAAAAVNVTDVSVQPEPPLWLSESFDMHVTCEPGTSDAVYVESVTRNGVKHPAGEDDLLFDKSNAEYTLGGDAIKTFFEERDGYRPGTYDFDLVCRDDGVTDTAAYAFTVRTLAASVEGGWTSNTAYAGEKKQVNVRLVENRSGSPIVIDDNASFSVAFDGNTQQLPYSYDSDAKEWILYPTVPDQPGNYDMTITAAYDGATDVITRDTQVAETLQFGASLSSTAVSTGQNVTLTVSATHKGDPLRIEADDITVTLGDESVDVTPQQIGEDASTFTVTMPERNPGTYEMTVTLERDVNGETVTATDTISVDYPVPVVGAFRDRSDNTQSFALEFTQGGNTVLSFNGDGEYRNSIVPGTYNVSARFTDALIELWNVDVDAWEEPFRFEQYRSGVEGMVSAGLYAYRTDLSYDDATLTLRYRTDVVDNPENLRVYRCGGWNFEQGTCYGTWTAVDASFNAVTSRAVVETDAEGAFVIGRRSGLRLKYATESIASSYTPDEVVSFTGLVRNANGDRLGNASVTVDVDGADVSRETRTADDGSFDVAFPVPDRAGTYTVTLTAAKDPYRDVSRAFTIDVERPAGVDIVVPENVRITQNTTKTASLYVQNTGFKTLSDLQPQTKDIPFLDGVAFDARPLAMNESRSVELTFAVPVNASTGTHKAEIKFTYDGESTSKVFGVVVEESTVEQVAAETDGNETMTVSGMVTDRMPAMSDLSAVSVPDGSSLTTVVLLIVAVQILVVVFVAVRSRLTDAAGTREHVVQAVDGIKQEVGTTSNTKGSRQAAGVRQRDGVEREHVLRAISHIKDELRR